MTATTVWGVATQVNGVAAYYGKWGTLTDAHSYRSLALELPPDGVAIDCDHDHEERGRLVYAELGDDDALRVVAVVDGDLTGLEQPAYFSAEVELRGDVGKRYCIAREAALVGLSLTFSPATIGAWPINTRTGDIRRSLDRGGWSCSWKYHDPLLERALHNIGSGLGVEQRAATRIVNMGRKRVPPLESGTRGPIEIRSAASVDVAPSGRVIELIAAPYNREAIVDYQGRTIVESIGNTAFAQVDRQSNRDRIRANRDHDMRKVVGRVTDLDPYDRVGLRAEIRISRTQLGDETIELAKDELLDGSIGFAIPEESGQVWESRDRRRVTRAWLDHVALVGAPAYTDARVTGVRGRELRAQH